MRLTTCLVITTLFAQSTQVGWAAQQQDPRRQPAQVQRTPPSLARPSSATTNQPHGHPAETNPGPRPCEYGDPRCGRGQTPPPPHRDDHTGRNVAIGVGVGAVAGLIIAGAAASHHNHNYNSAAKTISDHGPQYPEFLHMSTFQVTGFMKGGWPLVVDYEAETGTYAVLTVVTENALQFTQPLDVGQGERRLLILQLPTALGSDLKMAAFTIRATVSPRDDRLRYLRIYGFGCGKKAVGSVAIDQLRFGPATISKGQTDTQFSFHSHTDFEKMRAEFMQVRLVDNCIEGQLAGDKSIGHRVAENDSVHERWDAKKVAQGQIQLRVRGWMTAGGGGDWVSAFSPDLVLKN